MSDGEAVIRLDADVSSYINKVVRAQKETKEAGKGLQQDAQKWLETNMKSLATLGSTLVVVNAIGEAAKKYAENMAKASEAGGRQQISESQIMARMGKGAGAARSLLSDQDALATRDQKLAFLGQLSGIQEQRRASNLPQLKPGEVNTLTTMFGQGGEAAYGAGGGDLLKAVGDMPAGVPVEQSIKKFLGGRLGMLPGQAFKQNVNDLNRRYMQTIDPGALEELGVQAEMDKMQQDTQADAIDTGKRARILAARKARREFDHPGIGLAKDLLGHVGVPGTNIDLGHVVQAGEDMSTAAAASNERDFQDVTRQTSQYSTTRLLQSIDNSLKQQVKPNLPNLNTRTERTP